MQLLEPRATPSKVMQWAAPPIAIALTLLVGAILFWGLGVSPVNAFYVFFIEPLETPNGWCELVL